MYARKAVVRSAFRRPISREIEFVFRGIEKDRTRVDADQADKRGFVFLKIGENQYHLRNPRSIEILGKQLYC